jgi:hypothetical protein
VRETAKRAPHTLDYELRVAPLLPRFLQTLLVSAERAEKFTKSARAGFDEVVPPLSSATHVQVAGSGPASKKIECQLSAWLMFCF